MAAPAQGEALSRPLAIVNTQIYHSEVVMGTLDALRPLAPRTAVYVHPRVEEGKDGLRDVVRRMYPGDLLRIPPRNSTDFVAGHKVAFFISPGNSPEYTRFFINASRPHTVVLMIHNADDPNLPRLMAMHSRIRLVALSPHVVAALQRRGFEATWWLAAWPAYAGCPTLRNGTVREPWGFACQGRIDSRRRSYDTLWAELKRAVETEEAAAAARARAKSKGGAAAAAKLAVPPPAPRLKILGRLVKPDMELPVPSAVRRLVTMVTYAPYKQFFNYIACSHALLPLFANESYLTTKFSSTVLASLSTETPVLADRAFLAAYTFLDERSIYLQAEGEGLVAAMQRVQAMPAAEHAARRSALALLRDKLNAAARAFLEGLLAEAGG
ncbi:hypothetical protein GPECTOR_39g425 [Gonium pectorale]|uniref:Uncharacterized protein n=1 Tax=Gonium pectorale TaxID=33097 RepID=A0A150GAQ6_GONPE|nr:hypothetical protein GPECTOR_39g425 [Gonium pectorale]|eukprot:KXZ46931.1 hypothetical protein GPECTOR_39g425 [Gonium pectorale]